MGKSMDKFRSLRSPMEERKRALFCSLRELKGWRKKRDIGGDRKGINTPVSPNGHFKSSLLVRHCRTWQDNKDWSGVQVVLAR
jgi:hypothetical protein